MPRVVTRHFRDPFPALSHWLGAVLAVVGTVALLGAVGNRHGALPAAVIYGASLIGLFSASAFYHTVLVSDDEAEWFVRFDYTAIYLLIAGTYTPVCLLGMRGGAGLAIVIVEWALSAIGIVWVFSGMRFPMTLRILIYLAMGWAVLFALPATVRGLTLRECGWLLAGGLFYSLGAVVYGTKRPGLWPGTFGNHDLWHSMVLAGAGCHYLSVYSLVASAA